MLTEEFKTFSNGTKHIAGYCPLCGSFVKYIPQQLDPLEKRMPFGKHKGKKLVEIPKDYLLWALDSGALKGSLRLSAKEIVETKNP